MIRSPAAVAASLTFAVTAFGCGDAGAPPSGNNAGPASTSPAAPEFDAPIVFQRSANGDITAAERPFRGGSDIWIMEGDGTGLRLVRAGGLRRLDQPSLTFDRRSVVYAEFTDAEAGFEAGARIFREQLAGTHARPGSAGAPPGQARGEREVLREVEGCAVHHASISPITRQLAYTRTCPDGDGFKRGLILELSDRRRIDAANTTALELGAGVGLQRAILFQAEGDSAVGEQRSEIGIIRFDGYGQGTYTALTDRDHRHQRPAISPDGQTIAWQTNQAAQTDDIFLAAIDGSNQRRLTHSPANDRHPWFSRNGRWIVFESDRSGNREIWKIEIATGQTVQLTDDEAYASIRPRW